MKQNHFFKRRIELGNGLHQVGLFRALSNLIRRGNALERRSEHHALDPRGAPQVAAAVERDFQKPRLLVPFLNFGRSGQKPHENILAYVLRLLLIAQVEVRHAQHVVRILGVQPLEQFVHIRLIRHRTAAPAFCSHILKRRRASVSCIFWKETLKNPAFRGKFPPPEVWLKMRTFIPTIIINGRLRPVLPVSSKKWQFLFRCVPFFSAAQGAAKIIRKISLFRQGSTNFPPCAFVSNSVFLWN